MEDREIFVNGTSYLVKPYRDYGKNAIARVKNNIIYIKIPTHWGREFADKIATKLETRMVTAIAKGRCINSSPSFYHLNKVTVFGVDYKIEKTETNAKINRVRIIQNIIKLKIYNKLSDHEKKEVTDNLVRRALSRELLPLIISKVSDMNNRRFQSELGKVSIRQQSSRWGSCSLNNNISINFSLLFLPNEILEYVIVHELSHTKVRNHSKKFWQVVENVMPDFIEKRRWLKKEARKELVRMFNSKN